MKLVQEFHFVKKKGFGSTLIYVFDDSVDDNIHS